MPSFHTLSHALSRSLNRSSMRALTCSRSGVRRARQPGDLRVACRCLSQALRIHRRMAKRDPHLFGPHAGRYYLDTLRLAQEQQEIEAALCRVYGPPSPGESSSVSTVWTDRYVFRTPREHRLHLRRFKEHYGQ